MKYIIVSCISLFLSFTLYADSKIKIETSAGDMYLQLNSKQAPNTVKNFKEYVKSGFYKGTVFHRVIDKFMIQGGGFNPGQSDPKKTTKAEIKNEGKNNLEYKTKIGAINKRGTIAMARTELPHSATSQFFINHKDNGFLDFKAPTRGKWGYTVFGQFVDGDRGKESEVTLNKIATTSVQSDRPVTDIIIKKISIIK